MRKPIVGETLYAVWQGRKGYNVKNQEVTVEKVGRKYFYVSSLLFEPRFFIENWRQEYTYGTADWVLYESKEKYDEYKDFCDLCDEFRGIFGGYSKPKITLDQARRIKSIVDETTGGIANE
ncbi:hypothetical protein GMB51_16365 [Turicibacter sanguinis]|jgi:hypothetical protein|uniref:beta barrel domain-containing protein n=1 Tax=Turicibacter sanguinis TaxID=154288 RepID=UPI0012BCC678|nr:hypothetical protein [Turicibacter sanguinis]MCU7195957.1 hypothetical protein [Turicibacter sanguinis]MTN46605.1 hypothetical protein [Turicibacter sanguinis]MTN52321.1 hypothetical protein [Turicibacter sanguinis]MTN53773.1 hypothetical protein [Turicibacter sanguinis]MTN58615.1 hypothetical protein [Turicibacter sanguinis]